MLCVQAQEVQLHALAVVERLQKQTILLQQRSVVQRL
jgi:hypothetical protein